VSIIVPAHNEEAVIVETVRAMLALRYSEFEVIVVDDGSTDRTFERLREAFSLAPIDRVVPRQVATIGAVKAVYASVASEPLIVIRKESVGSRADAVNLGLDLARYPLICMVDADSILEEHALLALVKPFVDDPVRVVASGGVIRVAYGDSVFRGDDDAPRASRRLLPRIQSVEYLRTFGLARIAWARLRSLLVISRAFGVFRRDVVLEIGGLDPRSLGEDAELVTTMHEHLRREKRDYRIAFVAEPLCWTEVPEDRSELAAQRQRWSRGVAQLVRKHRGMVGNPRFGRIGLLALPYYLVFVLLAPVIELVALVTVVAALLLGAVSVWSAATIALAAAGYGLFVSSCALALEEFAFHRYHRWWDLQRSFAAAVIENIGYRQLHAWWRLRGLYDQLRGRDTTWDEMVRRGFHIAQDDFSTSCESRVTSSAMHASQSQNTQSNSSTDSSQPASV
jgi:cellulose synthase/poly-beta-1,6-N-acetylglucosamine synthase-like glycosyltransferase